MTLARNAASRIVSFVSMGKVSFDGRTVMVWVMVMDVKNGFINWKIGLIVPLSRNNAQGGLRPIWDGHKKAAWECGFWRATRQVFMALTVKINCQTMWDYALCAKWWCFIGTGINGLQVVAFSKIQEKFKCDRMTGFSGWTGFVLSFAFSLTLSPTDWLKAKWILEIHTKTNSINFFIH